MTHLTKEEREKLELEWGFSQPAQSIGATQQLVYMHGGGEYHGQTVQDWWLSQIDKILEEREKKEQEELKWIKDTLDAVYEKLTSL